MRLFRGLLCQSVLTVWYGGQLILNPGWSTYLYIATVLTAGTAFLMWLGEQITAKGVGNGISIIIFAGIAAAIPSVISQMYAQQFENTRRSIVHEYRYSCY